MELSLLFPIPPYQQQHISTLHNKSLCFFTPNSTTGRRPISRNSSLVRCCCSVGDSPLPATVSIRSDGRRALMSCVLAAVAGTYICDVAEAVSTSRRALRGAKIPDSEFTVLPNGLKYYDLTIGNGTKAVKGSRVAVWL